MIDVLVAAGHPVATCFRILGVSKPGYYRYKHRPTSSTQMRREWLTGLIREVHTASRGTYGYRRVHAELTMGMNVKVSEHLVGNLMRLEGIYGLPGPTRIKRLRGVVTADDLVNRKFHRMKPNELWVTDITQHRTREGWLYCCCVLDAFSRKIVGWSIDSSPDTRLVLNALDMAIRAAGCDVNLADEPGEPLAAHLRRGGRAMLVAVVAGLGHAQDAAAGQDGVSGGDEDVDHRVDSFG